MQRFGLAPSARLAFRASFARHVVMSEAALKANPAKSKPTTSQETDWDKVMEHAKSDVMRAEIEQAMKDGESLEVQEQPGGTINYQELLPRGGMRSFEWADLSEVVSSEEGMKKLNQIRTAVEEIQEWIRTNEKPADSIDWKYYHSQLDQVVPGFVDMAQAALSEALAAQPDIDLSPHLDQVKKQAAAVDTAVEEYVSGIEEIQKLLNTDAERINTERPITAMTTEEALALFPDMAKEIEAEIAAGNWNP